MLYATDDNAFLIVKSAAYPVIKFRTDRYKIFLYLFMFFTCNYTTAYVYNNKTSTWEPTKCIYNLKMQHK